MQDQTCANEETGVRLLDRQCTLTCNSVVDLPRPKGIFSRKKRIARPPFWFFRVSGTLTLLETLAPTCEPKRRYLEVLKKPTPWARWEEDDDGELPELPWKKATSCAALPDLDDEKYAQAAYKAPASASPPMMKPKSHASVAKASVVAAALSQPAAAPKQRVAASMPSADLKPSATACKLAADKVTRAHTMCISVPRVLLPKAVFAR